MDDVSQTRYSFGEKWRNTSDYQLGGKLGFDEDTLNWLITRNGFGSLSEFRDYLLNFETIIDAGCGNGRILGLFADILTKENLLYGFDFASAEIARSNLGVSVQGVFDADLMDANSLKNLPKADFIYCQEVLHHTYDPNIAFNNLVSQLNNGGEIAIYVYKKKAPIREFTDDYIRGIVENLQYDEALELTRDFTEFGRVLSDLNIEVNVPELRLLEIPAGTYQVQRLFYHFFLKCYWNPHLSREINDAVNFDWYHPSICSRHTVEEVLGWFEVNNLKVIHEYEDEYGITLRGTKPNL